MRIDSSQNIGIGTPALTDTKLAVEVSYANTSGTLYSAFISGTLDPTSTSTANMFGLTSYLYNTSASTINGAARSGYFVVEGSGTGNMAIIASLNGAAVMLTGSATTAYGTIGEVDVEGSATITTAIGLAGVARIISGTGSITTGFGIQAVASEVGSGTISYYAAFCSDVKLPPPTIPICCLARQPFPAATGACTSLPVTAITSPAKLASVKCRRQPLCTYRWHSDCWYVPNQAGGRDQFDDARGRGHRVRRQQALLYASWHPMLGQPGRWRHHQHDQRVDTTAESTAYTYLLAANELTAGRVLRVTLLGRYSTANGTDTFTLRLKLGSTTLISIVSSGSSVTNVPLKAVLTLTVRSTEERIRIRVRRGHAQPHRQERDQYRDDHYQYHDCREHYGDGPVTAANAGSAFDRSGVQRIPELEPDTDNSRLAATRLLQSTLPSLSAQLPCAEWKGIACQRPKQITSRCKVLPAFGSLGLWIRTFLVPHPTTKPRIVARAGSRYPLARLGW